MAGLSWTSFEGNCQMLLEDSLLLLSGKHASGTLTITQPADIEIQFAIKNTVAAINLPSGFGLKGQIEDELNHHQATRILVLKLPARKAIVDHAVSCPKIKKKAMQKKNNQENIYC